MSLLGEYKWNIFDDLTLYSGLRFDDSERLDSNLSSRVALVKSFGDSDVLKITFNNSVRNPVESAIQESKQNNAAPGEVETIKFLEGRWEHVINENINFAFGGYYADHDISAFSSSNFTAEVLGNTKYYGIEIEFSYNTENTKFSIAHNVTDLINFDLTDLTLERQQISSNPYGYGSNFANWSKHQTTINAVYTITDKIETNASLTILWGFPGLEDYASYNMIELGGILNLPLTDGSTRAFEESVFLNFGARYQVNDDMFVRLNAHNVLGLADKKLNKTNVFIRSGMYQSQAASLSISLDFNF